MAQVLLVDHETGEEVETITVAPPRRATVTVGDMFMAIQDAVAGLGHELHGLDLADEIDIGLEIPEDVEYVAYIVVGEGEPRGPKEWRPN